MTEPVTFHFVRHGESEANAARRFAGRTDSPLTERGREQAEAVAKALAKIPLRPHRLEPALAVPRHSARYRAPSSAARSISSPIWWRSTSGIGRERHSTRPAALPEWSDDGFVAWPRGETLDQVLARAHRVITRIASENAGPARSRGRRTAA